MNKHLIPLLLLAATAAQAANLDLYYLQERSDGKTEKRTVTLTPGTYLNIDDSGHLQVRTTSQVRSDLSVNNVENTALSTWAGSTNLTTLAPNAARNNLTAGTGTLNLSLYTLTLPSDVSRLGSDIDLGTSEVTGTLPISRGGTGSTSASGAFGNIKQPASTSATGVVQIATNGEVQTGTDSLKAVVPSSLAAWWAWKLGVSNTWTLPQIFSSTIRAEGDYSDGSGNGQIKVGKLGQSGRIGFVRASDGATTGVIGFTSASEGSVMVIAASGGAGLIRFDVNDSSGVSTAGSINWASGLQLVRNLGTAGNFTAGDSPTDLFTVYPANPTAPNAYNMPAWPGVSGSPGSTTFMTRDAVRYDILDPTNISFVEEFGTGGTSSGSIGQLGWNLAGTGAVENSTGITNLPGGLHIRTSSVSSTLPVFAAYLGNTPGFRGGSFMGAFSSAGEIRTVAAVGTLNVIDSVAWSYTLGRDGNPPSFDKITPPNSIGVRYIPFAGTAWAGSTAYAVGANVRPVTANGYKYICTTAGTSASAEPTWPTTLKGTVVDGTVTWTCAGANGDSGSKLQFFVAGANAETSTTIGTSTVSGSTNSRILLRVRTVGGNAYFSANGEPEVSLAMPAGSFAMFPAFNVRNDTNTPTPDLSIYTWRAINTGGVY